MLRLVTNAPQCSKRVYRALKIFDDAEDIFNADREFFLDSGFKEDQIDSFFSKNTADAEKYLEYCEKNGIKIITYYDEAYPSQLREIEEPPAILFVKGELPPMRSCPTLGIVGTRECSPYGGKFAAGLAYELAQTGFIIVSGMARGIDTFAHKGALLAGGQTVAVLPSGVDIVTPSSNSELYARICDSGAVISEYLPKTQCRPYNFHLRNRVISGLSQGISVIETGLKGGSMITVRHALEQGKMIFAVPGSPGSKTSEGTNRLLRDGATLCTGSEDVISEYEIFFGQKFERPKRSAKVSVPAEAPLSQSVKKPVSAPKKAKIPTENKPRESKLETASAPVPKPVLYCALTEKEELVINALKDGPLSLDAVCDITGIIFPQAVSILNGFEMNGYVESLPGGSYKLKD